MGRVTIILDCADPAGLAPFWKQALGYVEVDWPGENYAVLVEDGGTGPVFALQQVPEPKSVKNRMHIDIHVEDLDAEIQRLTGLGASVAETPRMHEGGFSWQTLLDPEGNEFCLVSP